MPLVLTNMLSFLTNVIFGAYIVAVLLRFFLQWVKADFYHPLCQLLIKLTNPLLLPLRKIVPGWFGVDCAAVVLAVLLQCVEIALLTWLYHYPITGFLVVIGVIKLLVLILNLYFFAIILRAIASWFAANSYQPNLVLLQQFTEPLLRPVRKILPPISGIDLSPLVVLIILQLISIGLQTWLMP